MIGKIFAGIVGGLIVAVLGSFVVTLALAANPEHGGGAGAGAFFALWTAAIIVAAIAKTAGKAWRRLMITSALLSFALPLSSLIFSGTSVSQAASDGGEFSGAAAAGAALGGGVITMASGVLGFFLGAIFLVIGLLTGREKQVVVVHHTPSEAN